MTGLRELDKASWPFHRTWTTYDHVTFYGYSVALIGVGMLLRSCL